MKMYKCKKCGYHFGRPWMFAGKKEKLWKPRCTACGSDDVVFDGEIRGF